MVCATCIAGAPRTSRAPVTVARLGEHAGPLRGWVIDVKHAQWESMGERLGEELGAQLARCGVIGPNEPGTVLVPVPTPWLRVRERGIDHTGVLAAAAAAALGVRVVRPLRQRAFGTQVDRSSRVGRAHIRARFELAGRLPRCRAAVAGRHAVVIDDVRTTGATLAEVSSWLRWLGATRVDAGVLSVVS
jgi:predicted amidophosphoribosyltransferase